MTQIEKAIAFATKRHKGQFRRDGITPYINHPESVARTFSLEALVVVAWLHDVLEDTDATVHDLVQEGFSQEVIGAVVALTKTEGVSYDDYLANVKTNTLARLVKLADMSCNLKDNPTKKQIEKYKKGIAFLFPSYIFDV